MRSSVAGISASSSTAAEGCSKRTEHSLLELPQVDIMHNPQPSAAPLTKGHILRSCVLLVCLVGCAHSTAASDGKQLQSRTVSVTLSAPSTCPGTGLWSAARELTATHGLCSFCAVAIQWEHHQFCHSQQLQFLQGVVGCFCSMLWVDWHPV